MNKIHWLKEEAKTMAVLFFYFSFYFTIFIVFKKLILAHYDISFYGFSAALVAALVAAKAVIIIEHTPLAKPFHASAPFKKILYDTLVYTTFALLFLYLEKVVELAHKEGTFQLAFLTMGHDTDWYIFCATVGWGMLSFFGYSTFAALSRHLGRGELIRLLFTPRGSKHETTQVSDSSVRTP